MGKVIPSGFNLAAAIVCLSLAIIVLARNHRKTTHRSFAVLAVNLTLWALGVFAVIQCDTERAARTWIGFTEIVACFIPASFYHFAGYYPRGRFDGNRRFLRGLYIGATVLALATFTPWYVVDVRISADLPPRAQYGPAYFPFMVMVLLTMAALFINFRRKLRITTGFEHRQIQHVVFGVYCMALLTAIGILGSGYFQFDPMQAYGPISTIVLMSFFAYAMIRYHLLDTRALLARSIVMTVFTTFLVVALLGIVSLMQWTLSGTMQADQIISAFVAAAIVVLAFQLLKPHIEHIIEGAILKQRYNINQLYSRIAQQAAEQLQLNRLLSTVVEDIQHTINVRTIRVLLSDATDPSALTIEFSTEPDEERTVTHAHGPLLDYLRKHPQPILLEKILHHGATEETAGVAQHLADLDAYFCLPLKTSAGIVGIMTLGQKESHDVYTEDEVLAFHALGGPLGTAIANARLYSEIDSANLHMANLFTQMREGVIAVDINGKVTTVNEAAIKLVGEVEIGRTLDLLPEEIAELLQNTLDYQKDISDFETQIIGRDREEVPVIMSSSCLKGAGPGMTGAVALIYDLSQVKRLEQNVLRADRLSSIGTLAAGMAHEIKNPLVSIKTFAHLLLGRYEDPDFRTTFTDVVPHEVDRIDAIVSRLLDFARPKPVSFRPQSLERIVSGVLALVENQTRKSFIEVSTEFPEEDLLVYGDEQQLHQVFLNLVLNAIDAMSGGEQNLLHIEGKVDYMHLHRPGLQQSTNTECASLLISDSGCGIPEDDIQQLFTPFHTTKVDGCGLGLAVVHGIVAEHGGQIDVKSSVGRGTTFRVSLPMSQTVHPAEQAEKK